ncbi:hypothetical protein PGTUg99_005138 [Puccinia graminis f. sp. tritici]|uniref:Uncharacterized protein n=1 Tax=Puccinia graminis f. sp. tritici TaxID=56615 RepID=A0A5B0QKU6_PUCGR|nr:hypothetical protein PGTUg99_005138 [Puccinia graminis f. sp. tritici]
MEEIEEVGNVSASAFVPRSADKSNRAQLSSLYNPHYSVTQCHRAQLNSQAARAFQHPGSSSAAPQVLDSVVSIDPKENTADRESLGNMNSDFIVIKEPSSYDEMKSGLNGSVLWIRNNCIAFSFVGVSGLASLMVFAWLLALAVNKVLNYS